MRPNRPEMIRICLLLMALLPPLVIKAQNADYSKAKREQQLVRPLKLETESIQPSRKKAKSNAAKPTQKDKFSQPEKKTVNNTAPAKSEELESEDFSSSGLNLRDPQYWLNAFNEKRNELIGDDGMLSAAEENQLKQLVRQGEAYVPQSFEMNYIKIRQLRNKPEAAGYLEKAIKQGSLNNTLLLPEIAWIAERLGDLNNRQRAITEYANQGQLSKTQKQLAAWTMEVVEAGSLIITNGEFDTYPLWHMQNNKGVHVLSLAMMEDQAWLKRTILAWDPQCKPDERFDNPTELLRWLSKQTRKPVYVSLSVHSGILSPFIEYLHPVGPVARFSVSDWNNLKDLKAFYLREDVLNYLNLQSKTSDQFNPALANLMPGAYVLIETLERSGDPDLAKVEEVYRRLKMLTGKAIRP